VVATPIGNLRDITLRALDVLAGADLILCEDTRVSGKLMAAYGLKARLRPYHDHNGAEVRPEVLAALARGAVVALISDAGTPLISDPGYKLVRAVIEAGHPVVPVPGASALLAGMVVSGLPSDRVLFAGFLPPKTQARRTAIESLARVPATLVFYETGPRLAACLADLAAVLGPRPAAVARELTKLYEEVRRAPLDQLAAAYADAADPKGEIMVMVGGPLRPAVPTAEALDLALREALAALSVKDAATQVADQLGLPRREVYAKALALRGDDPA
jgi:16S rRNA (cytidine1402-2'-O)-methyltransferase